MAIYNFIPTVWSETLQQALNQRHIGVAHCNRDYEGDIREKGNTVRICGLENVNVYDYSKDVNMKTPDSLADFSTDLVIDHAKYFNFQIDDIDRVQSSPQLMKVAMANAANALADAADKAIFNMNLEMENTLSLTTGHSTIDTILSQIITARQMLYKENVVNNDDVVLEVSPAVATLIIRAKLNTLSENNQLMETGCIGNVMGCKVYVTKNIGSMPDPDTAGLELHRCYMRTKRAVAFAEQLSEIQAYRPELRFADAVKGLYLFGYKIVYPKEFVALTFRLTETAAEA